MALKKISLVAQKEHEGRRIDAVLAEWLPAEVGQEVSKGKVRKLIMAGAVYLNGRRIRIASKSLIPGATLEAFVDVERLKANQATLRDQPFTMDQSRVLFEDKWLIAIDKPPGLPTQPTLDDSRDNLYACLKKFLTRTSASTTASTATRRASCSSRKCKRRTPRPALFSSSTGSRSFITRSRSGRGSGPAR